LPRVTRSRPKCENQALPGRCYFSPRLLCLFTLHGLEKGGAAKCLPHQSALRSEDKMVTINQIKQLRQETGVSITECKKALEAAKGDFDKAKEVLRKWGRELAGKKAERKAGLGIIESYIHPNKKVGAMVELDCETDFVAKSEDFKKLAHELCLQITAMNPQEDSLLSQPWIKDETRTIKELIDEYIAKLGENIIVKRFVRYDI